MLLTCDGVGSARKAEALNQLIADREAKAVKPYVEPLKAADDSRAEMVGFCDQFRVENERLVAQRDAAIERAEKAEAELAAERARLLWALDHPEGFAEMADALFRQYTSNAAANQQLYYDAIDAAMKES